MSGLSSNVIVAVRVRPSNAQEAGCDSSRPIFQYLGDGCITFDPAYDSGHSDGFDTMTSGGGSMTRRRPTPGLKRAKNIKYKFDHIFAPDTSQQEVYEATAMKVVDKVVNGYSACVFAYGATGSGKTFTMVGSEGNEGIMVRTMDDLFGRINDICREQGDTTQATFEVSLSYLEIYCETIRDLLSEQRSEPLQLNEDKNGVVSVKGLTERKGLKSRADVFELLREGNKKRSQCATDQNHQSSRSHAVLQIQVRKMSPAAANKSGDGGVMAEMWTSKLSLIDLAGSERAASSKNTGSVQKEGANINRSLLALGQVINQLATRAKNSNKTASTPSTARTTASGAKAVRPKTASASSSSPSNSNFIAYRGSKLTRLLKETFAGGSSITVMIAAVSPSTLSLEDTHNTLKYADRAKQIKVDPKANVTNVKVHMSAYSDQIKQLQLQVANLVRENNELKSQHKSITANAFPSSRPTSTSSSTPHVVLDSATRARVEQFRSRLGALLASKDALERELSQLRNQALAVNIHLGLYRHTLTTIGDTAPESSRQLSEVVTELESEVREKNSRVRTVRTTKLEPLLARFEELKHELGTDTSLKSESDQLRMEMEFKLQGGALKEKEEMIENYSQLVSSISSHYHLSTKSLLKLFNFIQINTLTPTSPRSSSSSVAVAATSSISLFTPASNSLHAKFLTGVDKIVEEGLKPSTTDSAYGYEDEDENGDNFDSSQLDHIRSMEQSFVVQTLSPRSSPHKRVDGGHENEDDADQEATPEPPSNIHAFGATMKHASYASAVVTPSRPTVGVTRLHPITTSHGVTPNKFTPLLPIAAFTSQSMTPTMTPRRRSGGRRTNGKNRPRTQMELSATPLVRPITSEQSSPRDSADDHDVGVIDATPSKPLTYAAVIAQSTPRSTPLSSARPSMTPGPIIQNRPVLRDMFSPTLVRPSISSTTSPNGKEHHSPSHSSPQYPPPPRTAPSLEVVSSPSKKRAEPKAGIKEQLNQWHAELSQLSVMAAEQAVTKTKPQLLQSLDGRGQKRLHRHNASVGSAAAFANLANSQSAPVLPLPSSSSSSSTTAPTPPATASSNGNASSNAAGIKNIRARLAGLTQSTSSVPTVPLALSSPLVSSSSIPPTRSVVTLPPVTVTSTSVKTGPTLATRKPPVPKQLPINGKPIPTSSSSSSTSSTPLNRPLVPSVVPAPSPLELENEYEEVCASLAASNLHRPVTAPLGARTDSYSSQHNARLANVAAVAPSNGKPKLMTLHSKSNSITSMSPSVKKSSGPQLFQRPITAQTGHAR